MFNPEEPKQFDHLAMIRRTLEEHSLQEALNIANAIESYAALLRQEAYKKHPAPLIKFNCEKPTSKEKKVKVESNPFLHFKPRGGFKKH
ncbi:MAG: hypothetical protein JWN25_2983 [Verrucomicrobiales bacterium]|nr:hypothetical protein [Verrucomicrobiales bacterium]